MTIHKQKKSPRTVTNFLNYNPAELRIGSQWLVVFYAKNPITQEFERHRISVPAIKNKTERKEHGKRLAMEVNNKLQNGWLPCYDDTSNNTYKTFEYCITEYLDKTKIDFKKSNMREDTLRTYTSFAKMIKTYIESINKNYLLIMEFKSEMIRQYLDWIYYDRNNSLRTYNNHLAFIVQFLNYCLERGYITENYALKIKRKPKQEKIR